MSKNNTNKIYSLNIKYDKNYDYIESIIVTSYIDQSVRDLQRYEGNNQNGSWVKSLIEQAKSIAFSNNRYYGEELKVNIVIFLKQVKKLI